MTIIIDKLNVSFEGKQVLKDFSLQLPKTGVVCIVGPSGSGKTTLFKCLAGVISPDSGSISGLENKRISMVFQENRLLPWYDALRNVAFVLHDNYEAAKHFLAEVELTEAAHKYPAELSGGMQRRVAIARALAFGGDVLMMDEPTAGLDDELAERIMSRIVKDWQQKLILLITHDNAIAQSFATQQYNVEKVIV